jgi:hypothetical protein
MKTPNQITATNKLASLIAMAMAVTSGSAMAQGDAAMIPTVPGGWLTAYPTMVQTGTKPTLSWSITYPSTIASYTTIQAPATITTNDQLDVDVRVIGAGVTVGSPTGKNTNWVPTQALISVNGGEYKSIFLGTNDEVDPNALVWSKRVNKSTTFHFGGRFYFNGGWSQTYNSQNGNNIRILRNGEYPPTAYTLHESQHVKSFMAPYLDGGGRVKIGPLDAIIMMELTQPESNANNPGYNLQDMVLLMTCKPKNNHGHGNNIDGVDASNPGNAPFKKYDTDASIDDEGGGGGAAPSK